MAGPYGVPAASRPYGFTAAPRRVLFLCIHNSARSQIAEGFARAMAPAGTEVWSAGTEPRGVNPFAIAVMKEAHLDISAQQSRHLDQVPWQEADTVVTLCGEGDEVCPAVGGEVRRIHWPLPDPSSAPEAERLAAFRACRDEIRWRIASLWPPGDGAGTAGGSGAPQAT